MVKTVDQNNIRFSEHVKTYSELGYKLKVNNNYFIDFKLKFSVLNYVQ